jgi:16S rRNA (uracil1498-N3)-methyltransferase
MPKFFFNNNQISGDTVRITGEDARHLKNVLRVKTGETIILCDGGGTDYSCEVKGFEGEGILLCVNGKALSGTEPSVRVTLFQGMPKTDKMEMIIQKCVELGVYEITPVITDNTVSKPDNISAKTARWQKISESAAKQCMRGIIPEIKNAVCFSEALERAGRLDISVAPYENAENGIRGFIKEISGNKKISEIGVFIGPEGGFSVKEAGLFAKNNIPAVSLGKRILRTETAGFFTLAVLLYELDKEA